MRVCLWNLEGAKVSEALSEGLEVKIIIMIILRWEFPSSPRVRTQRFHCCGPSSIPGQGIKTPQDAQCCQKIIMLIIMLKMLFGFFFHFLTFVPNVQKHWRVKVRTQVILGGNPFIGNPLFHYR